MKILLLHNYYQQPGGEDVVLANEMSLLEANGHEVETYLVDNDDIRDMSAPAVAAGTIWSRRSYRRIRERVRQFQPTVAHFHNTLPLISPAGFHAARAEGAAVVQTLHNYRLACPGTTLFRDGHVCEDCLGKLPWRGVLHGCYRNSRLQTGGVAAMLATHRMLRTWTRKVDLYIALTAFARDKLLATGLRADRVVVKPNFLAGNVDVPDGSDGPRQGGLFVGRLSAEKGISPMLEAWRSLNVPLRLVGSGPLDAQVRNTGVASVEILGAQPREEVAALMRQAQFLVVPSVWYEGFPMVVVEAYAHGLPVIASRLGSLAEVVDDQVTGLHVNPGDPDDLAAKVAWAVSNSDRMREMGRNAQRRFQERYTADTNLRLLLACYDQAIARRGAEMRGATPTAA